MWTHSAPETATYLSRESKRNAAVGVITTLETAFSEWLRESRHDHIQRDVFSLDTLNEIAMREQKHLEPGGTRPARGLSKRTSEVSEEFGGFTP